MGQDDGRGPLEPETRDFYVRVLRLLNQSGIPYMVGGAYALAVHAGVERHTKDLDILVMRDDLDRLLAILADAGYRTEIPFPHWLAKAHHPDGHFIDLIYNSGNGLAEVDRGWFEHAVRGEVLGVPTLLGPVEEAIWTKAFIMERERFDGADVAHLIRALGTALDWDRLLGRFGAYWRVLLAHVVLFDFIYPSERGCIPDRVREGLVARWRDEPARGPDEKICRGTLLSRQQYLADVQLRGYADARLRPVGGMTPEEIARWTEAIDHG